MALEDYLEPEVGIAVALTAIVASPRIRTVLRRGAVYGLAGILMAGDAVTTFAQGVKRGVQQAADEPPVTSPEILSAETMETPDPAASIPDSPAPSKRSRKPAEAAAND